MLTQYRLGNDSSQASAFKCIASCARLVNVRAGRPWKLSTSRLSVNTRWRSVVGWPARAWKATRVAAITRGKPEATEEAA